MPEIKQIHEFIKANDNMEMLTVNMNCRSQSQDLRDVIRKHRIKYPVLFMFEENGFQDGAFGWEITNTGIPAGYIIDPMGNIFSHEYPNVEVMDLMGWLAAQDKPVLNTGLSTSTQNQDDGSVLVNVQMSSPTHEPLDIKVSVTKMVLWYGTDEDKEGTGEPIGFEFTDLEDLGLDFTQEFEMFGDAVHSFVIPAQPDAFFLNMKVNANVPGMEDYNEGNGFSVTSRQLIRVNEDEE